MNKIIFFSFLLLTFALFVSGQSQKEPSLDHFSADGYELTKYIKVSQTNGFNAVQIRKYFSVKLIYIFYREAQFFE